ncbi:non-ribosomal peptide synthetase [Sciscionella marina]|uniref:non-ribosomal peptide synthetase n=1 Tax=Sciscionella marina TaxID=508770 RepID=UPI000380E6FB|nr:non-ribosomal peptide synthetase [Sciscionella marina]
MADGVLPLTDAQRGVWFANRLDPGNPSYAVAECVRIPGAIDLECFARALRRTVADIEVLRGSVVEDTEGGTVLRVTTEIEDFPFAFLDLSAENDPERSAREWIADLLDEPVDVTSAPAFSFTLLRLSEAEYLWVQRYHHVLLDGVGMTLVQRRVAEVYTALVRGETVAAAEFPPSAALADAERAYRESPECARDREYWTGLLADRPEPASVAAQASGTPERLLRRTTHLDRAALERVHAAAREIGIAWPSLLVAGFGLYLERVGGGRPVVLGLPVAARGAKLGTVPGMATNIVPLRLETAAAQDIAGLAKHTAKRLREAVKHQRYRYEQLRAELGLLAGEQRLTGPQVNIVLFDYELDFAGVPAESRNLAGGPVDELSLVLDARCPDGGLDLILDANPELFTEAELDAFAERLRSLFTTLTEVPPETMTASFSVSTPEECSRVLEEFASKAVAIPESTLYAEFIAQAARTPDAPAVRHAGQCLTYSELASAANRLARELIARGIGPEDFVAVTVPRSAPMMVALLGVLGAGAAYLPVDPNYPAERIEYLLADAKPVLALSTARARSVLPDSAEVLLLDESDVTESDREPGEDFPVSAAERVRPLYPEHPAYAIYTSGSTGKPKGVVVANRSAVDLACWARNTFGATGLAEVLASTSLNFDVSVFEMFGPLTCGGCIEIVRDLLELAERAERSWSGSLISAVPSALSAVLEHGEVRLRAEQVVLAGEALPGYLMHRIERAIPGARIANIYGPTEATVYAAAWYGAVPDREGRAAEPPIGKPLPNTGAYILDAALRPLPVGVTGELYLAGPGLARGYLDRRGLSAQRFLADPYGDGTRMYRTGDLARWNEHGEIVYLGRADDQIKIRGFRVELGEVESTLAEADGVAQAAVVFRDGRIAGYVVPLAGQGIDPAGLRTGIAGRLPDYMVPSAIVVLDALPLNANGKLDRKRLPDPEFGAEQGRAARTENERIACRIAAEVLGLDEVSPERNFFSLGGDSIIAIQFVNRARSAGLDLGPRQVFEHKTIERIAESAGRLETEAAHDESAGPVPLTPIMRRLVERTGPTAGYNQSVLIEAPAGMRAAEVPALVQRLLDRHDAFRIRVRAGQAEILESGAVPARVQTADSADVVALAEQARARLDPEQARLLEVVVLEGAPLQVLFVAHHYAVDGVSWRILLSELTEPSPVPVGFRSWAQRLAEREVRGELPYWRAQLAGPTAAAPTGQGESRHRFRFPAELTATLLDRLPAQWYAGVDELLLAALHRALPAIGVATGELPLLVDLERHGRQDEDLGRTVGWLTSMHPVRLEPCGDPLTTVRTVKEAMRSTPGDGHGYGLLRYRDGELAESPRPWLAFNYLGSLALTDRGWTLAEAGVLPGAQPGLTAEHALVVNAFLDGEQLVAELELHGASAERLAAAWQAELATLAEAARPGQCTGTPSARTPSDFPYATLNQHEVDVLEDTAGDLVDAVLPTPLAAGLVFHALYEQDTEDVYTVQVCFELSGELDEERLRAAAQRLLDRHDALRSGFATEGMREPVRFIVSGRELPWTSIDASTMDSAAVEELLTRWRTERFDLARPPLLRFDLLRFGADRYRLVFTHHHTLLDGWSLPVLGAELFALYSGAEPAETAGHEPYARWLANADRAAAEQAWAAYLEGLRGPSLLARGEPDAAPSSIRAQLPIEDLQERARERGITLNSLMQTAWALVLGTFTASEDVVFGATVSGRPAELPGVERMVGLFINTVPVRARVHPQRSLAETARLMQDEQTALREHQHLGLSAIQRASGQETLFDSLLVFENYPLDHAEFTPDGADFAVTGVHGSDATHYPVTLNITPGQQLEIRLDHRDGAVDRPLAEALLAAFTRVLSGELDLPAGRLRPASGRLLAGESRELPRITLPALFAQQAAETPEATALLLPENQHSGEERYSYREFEDRVARLAGRIAARGVARGDRVAVAVPRSVELVAALYAVQRLGAAYVPIDPDYPAERIEFMLGDCAPALLLTTSALAGGLPETARLLVDTEEIAEPVAPAEVSALDTAYVIYTSGSTGRPKGVAVSHGAIVNRLLWMRAEYGIGSGDVILQKTPSSFDVSVWEFFLPLLSGAALVVAEPDAHTDPAALTTLIERHAVTTVHFVPSMLQAFLAHSEPGSCLSLRRVICSGEALSPATRTRFGEVFGARLHNLYGPTEAAVDVTAWPCDPADSRPSVPIGKPVWNTRLYVLDSALRPVPEGISGDLYLAGPQLADAYTERRGLSATRFLADPFGAPGARMYRTGDLASVDGAGVLWFHGRADDQVKIRGFRVELGEIESVLAAANGVAECAVLARTDATGTARLIGYLTGTAEPEQLHAELAELLPAHMVPAAFVVLEEFPLTPSGKLDRGALPDPEFTGGSQAASGPVEEILCALFAETLGVAEVGAGDGFFALGGDSILSIKLVARAREHGLVCTPKDVFKHRTPAALAAVCTAAGTETGAVDGIGTLPVPPIARALLDRGGPIGGYHQSMRVHLPVEASEPVLRAALAALVEQHEALRARLLPEGLLEVPEPSTVDVLRIDADPESVAAELDPESGVMFRAAWDTSSGQLLLLAHHLVVDGISWQILLADLRTAYTAIATGQAPELPPVPVSYRGWARALEEHAQTVDPQFWRELGELPRIGARALDPAIDTVATVRRTGIRLSTTDTERLLGTVTESCHAHADEVLLAALAMAVRSWRGPDALLADLEGHGRDVLGDLGGDHLDTGRTVGWFTTLFPARIEIGGAQGAEVVKLTKEQVRNSTARGGEYGLARWTGERPELEHGAEIGFNYLGRMPAPEPGAFAPAGEGIGGGADPGMPLAHLLELTAVHSGDQLVIDVLAAGELIGEAELERFADALRTALTELAEHGGEGTGFTPSDLSLLELDQDDIDEFENELDEEWELSQ